MAAKPPLLRVSEGPRTDDDVVNVLLQSLVVQDKLLKIVALVGILVNL